MTQAERLSKAAHHIVHDYVNLVSAGTQIRLAPPPPLNSHVAYSFILQCRKFAHFFRNKESRGHDDMIARQFVGAKVHFKVPAWCAWDKHMDAHMFHLSYDRLKNTRPWTGGEHPEVLAEFRAAWTLFLSKLPPGLKDEFDKQIWLKVKPQSDFVYEELI